VSRRPNAALAPALNPEQLEAVRHTDGPLLILAGAGSGKTRVITYRIAHLLERGVPQSAILAVTFTNKAAREMSERVRSLLGRKLPSLTVCTFHAFGVKVLRQFGSHLGYRGNFTIYDESDRQTLLKEAARELGMLGPSLRRGAQPQSGDADTQSTAAEGRGADGGGPDLTRLSTLVSRLKSRLSSVGSLEGEVPGLESLFREYQHALRLHNAVDFDDLILLPVELFESEPEVTASLQERYRYFMVDEFQDTSRLQYQLIRLLATASGNLCVVGDDDQSIYSWRGAHFENLMEFERDFSPVREIKLEQNYRSTRRILLAANTLIHHNRNRKDKRLWSGLPEGDTIQVAFPEDEQQEGEWIANQIRRLALEERVPLRGFGVLVRTNSLTRAIEEAFVRQNLPYQVSGGMSFFQRREVKDILAYLKLIANPDDDVDFLRIINTPRRGLGKKSLEVIVQAARARECSLYAALAALAAEPASTEKAHALMREFVELVDGTRESFHRPRGMAAALRALIARIDYWGHLVQEHPRGAVARWKYANVEGVVDSIAAYEEDPDVVDPSLFGYLARISLITQDENQEAEHDQRVNLLTIHAAKGLEFDTVFLAGLEAGILPHARSLEESGGDLEEERRLFYVAITRAQRRLFLSACRSRRRRGQVYEAQPSPFLDELPEELLDLQQEEEELPPEDARRYFDEMKRRIGGGSA
jgi:DNA helicase-2/ATP-dependent DNA helicase PcrA